MREKLYSTMPTGTQARGSVPTLAELADWSEYAAFTALAGGILALALKGLAVAAGTAGLLVAGVFVNAFVGLLLTFVSLLVLAMLLDGGHEYREFVNSMGDGESDEREQVNR